MDRAGIRVLALASSVLACLGFALLAAAGPAAAAEPAAGPTPIPVPPFVEIAAGHQHACGRTGDGAVLCWGYGTFGQLGDGTGESAFAVPVEVVDLPAARAIIAGGNSTCAIDRDGGLWCWGANGSGQLGDGTVQDRWRPAQVGGLEQGVASAAIGDERACAVLDDGSGWCWGDNEHGELGDGTEQSSLVPVRVTAIAGPIGALSVGQWHTCARAGDGSAWCWGANWEGALGAGDAERHDGPVRVVGLDGGVRAIAAGYMQTCALRDDGTVVCWGDNAASVADADVPGILGVGSSEPVVSAPRRVVGLPDAIVAIGATTWSTPHLGALAADGSAWGWGDNEDAAVGPGAAARVQDTPVRAIATGVQGLAVGGDITAALLDTGEARWWGDGDPSPRIPWTGPTVTGSPGYRPTGPLVPTITTQIPTPADISTDPPVVGANLLLAAIAMIAFTIAIELLNRTLAEAEPFLRRRVGSLSRLDRARVRADALLAGHLGRGRAADAIRVIGIAAFYGLVFALLDPTWDPLSPTGLWLVLSFAVACGLVGIADDLATWSTARRWGVASEMAVRPGSLVAALVSTVATRALVLVPGVMIGTPEALDVDEERLDRPRRGRLAAMGLGAIGLVGGIAWLATLAAGPVASAVPAIGTLVRGLEAFLLLVFAVAVQNGFVQLLAFRDSAGRALLHVSKVAWAIALLLVTFAFWHTLVNPRGDLAEALGSTNVQAFLATVGVVLAGAAGAWLVAFVARRRASGPAEGAMAAVNRPVAAAALGASDATPAGVAALVGGPDHQKAATTQPAVDAVEPPTPPAPPPSAAEVLAMSEPMPVSSSPIPAAGPAATVATPGDQAAGWEAGPVGATPPGPGAAPTIAGVAPAGPAAPADGDDRVPCPRCAERILPAATACRFCGLDLVRFGAVTSPAVVPVGVAAGGSLLAAPPAAHAPASAALVGPAGRAATAPAVDFALNVPGNRRVAGPARLTVGPGGVVLDAGWIDQVTDRVATIVTVLALAVVVIPAVPILAAAADGRFHPERVQGLREALILVPLLALAAIVLVRRWRDRRRQPVRTSCALLAVEASTAADANTAVLAAALGALVGGVAWVFGVAPGMAAVIGIGGCLAALGLYLIAAGRTMVVLRAPLDPQRSRSVVIALRARGRDAATDVVAAIRDARANASATEVHA